MPSASAFKYERLDKNDAILLVVDHQMGLFQLVRDYPPEEYRTNIMAHASLGKVFNLPTILTTSAETGPNGLLPREIIEMHPDAPFIKRQGEVNAWDNAEFRAAVRATGKKQVILAGIVTDVCTTFLALSLVEEGYSVFANAEASGTLNAKIAADANDRMRAAGVQVMSMFAIACELMRDWRSTPGSLELLPFYDQKDKNRSCAWILDPEVRSGAQLMIKLAQPGFVQASSRGLINTQAQPRHFHKRRKPEMQAHTQAPSS